MYIRQIKPKPQLTPYITNFYFWLQCDNFPVLNIFPGTGVEILFNLGETLTVQSQQEKRLRHGECIVICPRKSMLKLQAATAINVLAIRFRSAAFFTLFNLPLTELSDQAFSVSDFFPARLLNQLLESKGDLYKTVLLEQWLLELTAKVKKHDSALHWAIDKIYYQYNDDVMSEVKSQLKCSERTFQRKFKLFTGVDAKYFERTARFQSTIKALLIMRSKQYIDIALNNGYYDQPHFIRDFKFFTQLTPGEYLTEKNFSANYYITR